MKKIFTKHIAAALLCFVASASLVQADNKGQMEMTVVHHEKSLYRDVYVYESPQIRCMGFGVKNGINIMGCESLKTPDVLVLQYSKLLLGSLYLNPNPQKILVLGMGIATVPKRLAQLYPNAHIDMVEIDPSVVSVADKFFQIKPKQRQKIYTEDGRIFVKKAIKKGDKYDLVILDAFNSDYIPEHMLTKEFLEEVKQILTPTGVLAANTFSTSGLYPNESATYAAVFGQFYNLKDSNRVILVKMDGLPPLETVLANSVDLDALLSQLGIERNWLVAHFSTVRDWPADARVLTDQYSPSNLLNAKKP